MYLIAYLVTYFIENLVCYIDLILKLLKAIEAVGLKIVMNNLTFLVISINNKNI